MNEAALLVLADELIEKGDPRGEFIAVQCKLAGGRLGPADTKKAKAREAELLAAHREEWFGPLEKWLREKDPYSLNHLKLARGFVSHCRLTITEPADLATLFKKAPQLESLELRGDQTPSVAQLRQLRWLEADGACADSLAVAGPVLDGLEFLSLNLGGARVSLELAKRPALRTLKVNRALTAKVTLPRTLEALGWSGDFTHLVPALGVGLPQLRWLGLTGLEVDAAAREVLHRYAPVLETLALDGAKFGKGQLEALLATEWPALRSLDLSNVGLGVDGAKRLAVMRAPKLELLDLTYTRLKDEGAAAVLSSPLLGSLKELSLRANKLTVAAVAPVLKRKHQLRLLNLKKNVVSAAELKRLEKALPGIRLSR